MKSLYVILVALLSIPCMGQDITGDWQAVVQEHGISVRYVLHVAKTDHGIEATFDVPEQFLFGGAVDSASWNKSAFQFRASLVSYEGSLSADGQTIQGKWAVGAEAQSVDWRRASPTPANHVETVAKALAGLAYLPAEKWKIHAGDVPHGETSDVDDSSWQEAGPGTIVPDSAVWFRRWIEVPNNLNGYDLTGAKIWFEFQYDANGPVTEIVYFDGRRIAMGEELEPIVLFDHARPGEKTLVAVKLLRSVDKKHFLGVRLRIESPGSRPSPANLLAEMGAASILAAASPDSQKQDSQKLKNGLAQSAATVDLSELKAADQSSFDQSLKNATSALTPLKPDLQQSSVWLVGNSHIDAAWLWPWTETVDVVRRTFGTSLQLMDEFPQATYAQSAAAYSEWMYEKYPQLHRQIVDRVKEGRWELVGGMWVEPDLNMPDGESLVRQLLIGKRFFKDKFGVDVRVGWNPDSFGYNWQLPQIYKRSGIDYFVTQKMAWNDSNQLPLKIFWWQSPDGSRVLTYFPHDYVNDMEPLRIVRDLATSEELNPGSKEMMHLFGMGDHGGGVTRAMLEDGTRWSDPNFIFPQTSFRTAQGFFSDIQSKADTEHAPVWNYMSLAEGKSHLPDSSPGKFSLPVWNDELYFEYHRGVFTTQAQHKWNMRHSEEQVLDAEKFASLAWLDGDAYPQAELTEAWKKVLFNQFHDLAAGSGVGQIYRDAQRDYDFVRLTSEQASNRALQTLKSEIDTRSARGVPVVVMNQLGWERTDLVSIEVQLPEPVNGPLFVVNSEGEPQPAQVLSRNAQRNSYELLTEVKNVPPVGYRTLFVANEGKPAATDLEAHGLTLENSMLRVTVDEKTGCISSLFDKKSRFEFIVPGGCGNELVAFQDTPKDYDAWNIDSDFDRKFTNLDKADSVELTEKGPLRATIRIVRTWQKSKFVQNISLYANLDRVDVSNEFDWHEDHVLLKASFPLAASSTMATYEIPYGSIARPTTRNNRFEAAKFEVPALRWADEGDGKHGLSLINESKYGYDAKGNLLRLSLLRSPTWPDPDADRGHHRFSYSLYPHNGDWKSALTVRRGYEFNYKLTASQVEPHPGRLPAAYSFAGLKDDHVVLTAIKKSEDADALIFRFYEWAGKAGNVQLSVPKGAAEAHRTNLMEKVEGMALPISAQGEVAVPVNPYEIVSVRADYPKDNTPTKAGP
jgi:alpha-mannosidase